MPDDAQQGEPSKEEALPSASRQGIGLCLSGGGYRATLFHLGALCRLNELGILTRPDFRSISSVSGGSIAAAGLASAWARGPVSPGEAWDREVRQPIRELTRHDIRTGAIARRLWPWNWLRSSASVEALTKSYEKRLTALRLADLPERPAFVLCATDMAFGVNWTFARDRMGDYQAGYATPPADFLLARAVAASACFPPVFEPMRLKLAPGALNGGKATGPPAAAARLDVRLTDGGAYDNMGLEPIWKSHAVVLVSDAGGLFTAEADKGFFWRIPRYQAIQETQARSLRKRWLLSSFRSGSLAGTYWGVGSAASRYGGEGGYSKAFARDVIAEIRTDLDAFSDIEAGVLENHGYFLADAAIKRHVPELVPEARSAAAETPPHPAWAPPGAGEAALGEALRGSEKRRLFGRG